MQDTGLWRDGVIYESHRLGLKKPEPTLPTHLFSLASFL